MKLSEILELNNFYNQISNYYLPYTDAKSVNKNKEILNPSVRAIQQEVKKIFDNYAQEDEEKNLVVDKDNINKYYENLNSTLNQEDTIDGLEPINIPKNVNEEEIKISPNVLEILTKNELIKNEV